MAGDVRDVALAGCLSRVLALRQRVADLERSYGDRTELAGTLLLLRSLAVVINYTERRLVTMRYRSEEPPAGEQLPPSDPADEHEINELGREDIAKTVQSLEELVGKCVSFVSVPHSRDFDPFVRPIGALARTIASSTEVIFRPLPTYVSYQISLPLNALLEAFLTDAPASLRRQAGALPTLVYLNYPATEEASTLHHLLIGHELGHLALRRHIPGHQGEIGSALATTALDSFKRSTTLAVPQLEVLSDRVTRWLIELACDRLGLRIVGPGYFLALLEHAALTRWFYDDSKRSSLDDDLSDYDRYPAMAWRVGSLWELVKDYLPSIIEDRPATKAANDVYSAANAMIPEWKWLTETDAGKIIADALEAYDAVESTLLADDEAAYPTDRFKSDLDRVWQKLESRIPPAECVFARRAPQQSAPARWTKGDVWSKPIDWRSILNGGYVHWLHDEGKQGFAKDFQGWRDRAQRRQDANALLRGAVELSEMHTQAHALGKQLRELSVIREVI